MAGTYIELNNLDAVQLNANKAIDLYTELGEKANRWGLPISYLYIAKAQLNEGELNTQKKEYSKAPIHFKSAIANFIKSQKLYRTQFSVPVANRINVQIGIAHYYLNNPMLADSFLTLGIKALENTDYTSMLEYIEDKRDAYLYLSKIDSIRGNWKDSHAHYQQYIAFRDELFNEENTKKTTTYQLQYEFDLKEAAQKAEQEKKELALQKELELKALNFEYEKKQAAAKNEKEKQQLRYEQQLKQQQIEADYARKTAQIEAEQRRKEAVAKLEQEKRDALNASALALSQAEAQRQNQQRNFFMVAFALLTALLGFIGYAYFQKQKANNLLLKQKAEINEKSLLLENSLTELKATQAQLIQSEKLASLGELTAGIAHEIQNPLNFVNNFAEVSAEMLDEMQEEWDKGDTEEAKAIADDLKSNLGKIALHGKRASSIVKGMLEHSRSSTGTKELSDLNLLADEYLRLAYHGLRAKDSGFNCQLVANLDPQLPKVAVIPQDIGRVLLNLINNALYAVQEKAKMGIEGYEPKVSISSALVDEQVEIQVQDNGLGIPEGIREKIFQPFFTTKPTGQGTGLGLSLAYDIVVKGHGGRLEVESEEGEGTGFIVKLPFL
jgi:signal transduction histidine kinase